MAAKTLQQINHHMIAHGAVDGGLAGGTDLMMQIRKRSWQVAMMAMMAELLLLLPELKSGGTAEHAWHDILVKRSGVL